MSNFPDVALEGKGFKVVKTNKAGTMKLMEYGVGNYAVRFYSAATAKWMDIESCETLPQARAAFKSFGG